MVLEVAATNPQKAFEQSLLEQTLGGDGIFRLLLLRFLLHRHACLRVGDHNERFLLGSELQIFQEVNKGCSLCPPIIILIRRAREKLCLHKLKLVANHEHTSTCHYLFAILLIAATILKVSL